MILDLQTFIREMKKIMHIWHSLVYSRLYYVFNFDLVVCLSSFPNLLVIDSLLYPLSELPWTTANKTHILGTKNIQS